MSFLKGFYVKYSFAGTFLSLYETHLYEKSCFQNPLQDE